MSKINPKNVYGLQSFEDAAMTAKGFKDAGGIILARNLEAVSAEIFTQEYPGLTLLSNAGIEVNNEGSGSTSITKLKLAINGQFVESGTNTNGTGKISLSGEDDTIPVFYAEAGSDWTSLQLKQADQQGINLPNRLVEAHAEVYNRKIDEIGYLGQVRTDGTQKTEGLLNFTGVASSGAGGAASTLTGIQLYQAIADLITDQHSAVFNVDTYMADRVVMRPEVYNVCAKKILNSAGSEMSVLRALQINFPDVMFYQTSKAESVGGTSVTAAYSSARRALQMRIPDPLSVSNVWELGHKYGVDSYFGVAGLDVIETSAIRYLTGL